MEVMNPRCAGLDVHKDSVVACVRLVEGGGKARTEVRKFGTVTTELLKLADWLMDEGCSHVAMEATGVYWRPVWAVLENAGAFELTLANAQHVKNVPGRKSDVSDAVWLADLLAHGLIRPSFVPPQDVQQMRELSRTRRQLVQEMSSHTLRIQKLLETANIKLSSVLSDVLGQSGRAILDALVAGVTDPNELMKHVNYRVKAAPQEIKEALRGTFNDHHRFLLKLHLSQVDHLEEAVRELEARLGQALDPFREKVTRVAEIPGLEVRSARTLLAETGLDMTRFATPEHLVSWANLCPRMDESAGKRRDTRIGKGGVWIKPILVQAAWCAIRTKNSYLRKKYNRIKSKRGAKKAIVAIAASILRAVWHILAHPDAEYRELGPDYFETATKERTARSLVNRLQRLGYRVDLKAA